MQFMYTGITGFPGKTRFVYDNQDNVFLFKILTE